MVIEEELDPHAIFASVGEVPYEWLIDSDRIVWGRNVGAVLPVADPAALDHGRSYAQLVDPNGGPSRFDAVMRASASDCGSGVPYQLQYALNAGGERKLWIEDTGRWFGGCDGRSIRAHGVVCVINERHEREQRLAYLSRFDALTGEMNRWYISECSRRWSRKR